MFRKTGFTIMELIIAIIIIGILVAIAIPRYLKTKESALDKEAKINLKLIRAGEKIYRLENASYVGCGSTAACNTILMLDLPTAANRNWDYIVFNANATAFTARAQRTDGSPQTWCIDEVREEPGSCP